MKFDKFDSETFLMFDSETFLNVDIYGGLAIGASSVIYLWASHSCLLVPFVLAFFIGFSWEVQHLRIPAFCQIHSERDLFWYPVAHAVWDALILVLGDLLFFKLSAILFFSMIQAILVEFLLNCNVWTYNITWWNPSIFHIRGENGVIIHEVTLIPVLEWFIAPFVYQVLLNAIATKCKVV